MNVDVTVARRSLPAWVNARTVLGALLFAVSLVGGLRVLQQADEGVVLWSAARDLRPGVAVSAEELRPVSVNLPLRAIANYVTAERALEGVVVTRPVSAGELIPVDSLARDATASPGRAMTIPLAATHAVGGAIRRGDRVDVLATFDPRTAAARTTLLATKVQVLDVVRDGGFVGDAASTVGITVAVPPDVAMKIALAIRSAEIDVVRIDDASTQPTAVTVFRKQLP